METGMTHNALILCNLDKECSIELFKILTFINVMLKEKKVFIQTQIQSLKKV
jgi:hypothetical protein